MIATPSQTRPGARRNQSLWFRLESFATLAIVGVAAAALPAAARADNAYAQLYATTCSPDIADNCLSAGALEPLSQGLNIGGGYAFASGYRGGFVIASTVFAPGAGPLLQSGVHSSGAVASYGYSFRVEGRPDTLVPLNVHGLLSSSAIHVTGENGQVVEFVEGASPTAPTLAWTVVNEATLRVGSARPTPYPNSGASISLQTSYQVGGGGNSFCRHCAGSYRVLDQTIWVWSNSDIQVNVQASAYLEYRALGNGLDPMTLFGHASIEADPTFSINDAAFADFTIVGVPTGFAPPSAVPEPQTWAMLLCGLGIVVLTVRRGATSFGADWPPSAPSSRCPQAGQQPGGRDRIGRTGSALAPVGVCRHRQPQRVCLVVGRPHRR